MATPPPPPKPHHPLHNFSLPPHLRWAHKTSSPNSSPTSHHHQHHRFRRRADSPDQHGHQRRNDTPPPSGKTASIVSPTDEEEAASNADPEAKPWKLRPRKTIAKTATFCAGDGDGNNETKANVVSNGVNVKSQRLRGSVDGGRQIERKAAKKKLWISLSREEIEEDVYALTGGKPARRPRKWPRNVQKHLENVFPGSYLVGVGADSYRVMMF